MRTEELIREFMASLVPPPGLFNQWQWAHFLVQFEPVVRQRVNAWARAKCPQPWSPQWGYMFALLRLTDSSWAPCHVRRRCRQSEPSNYEYAVVVSIQHDSNQVPMFMEKWPTPETLEYVWLAQWFEDADQAKTAFTLSHNLAVVAAQGKAEDNDTLDIVNEASAWAKGHHLSLHGDVVRLWESSSQIDYAGPQFTELMAYAFVETLELEHQHSEREIKLSIHLAVSVDVMMGSTVVSHSLPPMQAQALQRITQILLEEQERIRQRLILHNDYSWRELMFLCVPGGFLDFYLTSQGEVEWSWPSISLLNVLEPVIIQLTEDLSRLASEFLRQMGGPATVRVRFAFTSPHLAHADSLIRYMQMLTHTLKDDQYRPSNWSLEYDLKGNMPSMLVVDPSLNMFFIQSRLDDQDEHQRNALYKLLRAPRFQSGSCVRLEYGVIERKKRGVSSRAIDQSLIKAFSDSCSFVEHAEPQNHFMLNTHWPCYLDATTATCLWRRVGSRSNLSNLLPWQIEWPLRWPTNPHEVGRSKNVLHDEFDATNSNVERLYAPLAQGSVQP